MHQVTGPRRDGVYKDTAELHCFAGYSLLQSNPFKANFTITKSPKETFQTSTDNMMFLSLFSLAAVAATLTGVVALPRAADPGSPESLPNSAFAPASDAHLPGFPWANVTAFDLALVGAPARRRGDANTTDLFAKRQEDYPDFYWDGWICHSYSGGPGHQRLRETHQAFNRLFGNPRLTMARHQCYVATCRGLYLQVCNWAGVDRAETSNVRNVVVGRTPRDDHNCMSSSYDNMYVRYYFGYGDGGLIDFRNDRRRC
ncbi:hypothetical protein B0H66DRAFT_376319 [Apodospora peruviana]|uniref:Uncharacterized protein n=1 Tax=Apodospora peruviana TaxID=516989 RepID=A0AAE0HXF3_9PEZI|nr:hypothetical protein B0H66DRAFT_376319 [Apodospora peruviana]